MEKTLPLYEESKMPSKRGSGWPSSSVREREKGEVLVVVRDAYRTINLGMTTTGEAHGNVECLKRPAARL